MDIIWIRAGQFKVIVSDFFLQLDLRVCYRENSFWPIRDLCRTLLTIGEAPPPKNVYIWALPNLRFDPPIAQIRALCGTIFLPKMKKFLTQQF